MIVYIGSDHGGFELKEQLKSYVESLGMHIVDLGSYELISDDDYPDIAESLYNRVVEDKSWNKFLGILICGSGIGMEISANKFPGIRAARADAPQTAFFGRLHNNINVLTLGGLQSNTKSIDNVTDGNYANLIDAGMTLTSVSSAKRIVKAFLSTPTEAKEGSRHYRRIKKIARIEQKMNSEKK